MKTNNTIITIKGMNSEQLQAIEDCKELTDERTNTKAILTAICKFKHLSEQEQKYYELIKTFAEFVKVSSNYLDAEKLFKDLAKETALKGIN